MECFLRFLAERGRERVQDITASDLEAYRLALVDRSFAPCSIEVYLRTVRQFFAWLEQTQQLFLNPAAGFLIPKPVRKLLPVPSEEEIQRLLAQPNVRTRCGLRDRALLETAYSTGARRAELCALTVGDLNLEGGLVRVLGKGSKERMLPLGKQAVHWLREYLSQARPKFLQGQPDPRALWLNARGRPLSYFALEQVIHRQAQAANLATPITPHSLRRACATHMLGHGAHPVQLQLLLGHATLKTLSQYLRLTISELKSTHAQTAPGR